MEFVSYAVNRKPGIILAFDLVLYGKAFSLFASCVEKLHFALYFY